MYSAQGNDEVAGYEIQEHPIQQESPQLNDEVPWALVRANVGDGASSLPLEKTRT